MMFSRRALTALSLIALLPALACTDAAHKKVEAPGKSNAMLTVPKKQIVSAACAQTDEMTGINTRALQTELMVGALSCKKGEKYNTIVKRFKPELKGSSDDLKRYFTRAYGKQGTSKMDLFVTRLANEAAKRSRQTTSYCDAVENLYDDVLGLSGKQFNDYAMKPTFANASGIPECGSADARMVPVEKSSKPGAKSPAKAARKK